MSVPLIAKTLVHYAGRTFEAGESFDAVSAQDAKTLKAVGLAADPPRDADVSAGDESEPAPVGITRRTYKRRDMTAEG